MSPPGDGTRVVRAGLPEPAQGEPFLPGPTFAAPFHLRGDPGTSKYVYGRYGNPTWTAYERALAELEGAEAVLFASGMAAASALLLMLVEPGERLVVPSDCYWFVRKIAQEELQPRGAEVKLVPTPDLGAEALPDRFALLWLESPTNPGLEVCDIAALSAAAHERGALVCVDNTFATPLGQSPLALGADFSMTSATKHLAGHGDLVLGYVAARDPDGAVALREWRKLAGAVPGPFEAWLAHRSLPTLALRLDQGCANALALARLLVQAGVEGVRYPGLESDPAYELARRQMRRFGTVLSFDLGSRERAEGFLSTAELVTEATSFGGVHTVAERRGRWGGDEVPEGFIRLSAGIEDTDDLVEDVLRALDAVGGRP